MRLYHRALAYFRADRLLIITLLVLIGCSLQFTLMQAWPMAILVDTVLNPTPHADFMHRLFLAPLPRNRVAQIIGLTLIQLVLKVCVDTVWMLRVMINNRLRYNGQSRVRRELFAKFQDLGLPHQKTQPLGDSIYRLENDTAGIFGILDTVVATAVACLTLVGMTCIMLSRSVALTTFALSVGPLLMGVNLWFGRRIKTRALQSKQADTDLTSTVQRSMSTIGLVQAFCRQRDSDRAYAAAVKRSVDSGMRLNWQEALYPLAREAILGLGIAIIFGYGGYLIYRDQFLHPIAGGITCGDLIVFMAYLGQLWDPLSRLTGFFATIQGNVAATERVFTILDRKPAVVEDPRPRRLMLEPRELGLENIVFGYNAGNTILRGVTATIPAGKMVAFVGASGTGKSTLMTLLPRFFDPFAGRITLDGVDIRRVAVSDVRRHIALVSQDNTLLPISIAQNIAFGRPGADRAQVIAAAELVGADDFIADLPDGYDTIVAEGGQNLSGGQKQRLAIARALLSEAPILVLDEPTSAQDPAHERHIMDTLRAVRGDRTVVLVTHRLDTAVACDQIFVMDGGRILERGTHAELLAKGGLYFTLWNTQPTPPLNTDDNIFEAA